MHDLFPLVIIVQPAIATWSDYSTMVTATPLPWATILLETLPISGCFPK